MPTAITHAFVGAALGAACAPKQAARRFVAASTICSVLPDLDVIGFRLGIRYGDVLGHRGLSHSLFFALVMSAIVVPLVFRGMSGFSKRWWRLCLFFFAIMALHDVLDAMTRGGLGIAFFSPFDTIRYFLPWRPIEVAPIGVAVMFSRCGARALTSEFVWVWIPTILISGAVWAATRKHLFQIHGAQGQRTNGD